MIIDEDENDEPMLKMSIHVDWPLVLVDPTLFREFKTYNKNNEFFG